MVLIVILGCVLLILFFFYRSVAHLEAHPYDFLYDVAFVLKC